MKSSDYGHKSIKNEQTGNKEIEQEVLRLNQDYFSSEEFDNMTTKQVEENFPNDESYYKCYQYYGEKRRRLSCFARKTEEGLEIFVWPCSRRDVFSKEVAKQLYDMYITEGELVYPFKTSKKMENGRRMRAVEWKEAKPDIFTIPLDGRHPKTIFLSFLSENYNRKYPIWKMDGYEYLADRNII